MIKDVQKLVMGVDVGGGSVGLAVVSPAEEVIKGLHVRTFSRAETADRGESLNLERRQARLTRRRLRRRAHRMLRLRRLLVREGVVDRHTLDNMGPMDSWGLRAAGLKRQLEPKEWAAVLIHVIKHRGFLSNRKSDKADDEGGKLIAGVTGMAATLDESDYETIGEMVALSPDFSAHKRNKAGKYTHTLWRPLVREELYLLFDQQHKFGNPNAGDELLETITTLLMERRPVMAGDELLKMVGKCTFEPTEFRSPRACPSFEKFSWLSKLGNLKITEAGSSRELTAEELALLANLPFQLATVKWHQVRAKLSISDEATFNLVRYNHKGAPVETEKKTLAFDAKGYHKLKKVLNTGDTKAAWAQLSNDTETLDTLAWAQTVYKDDQASKDWLKEQGIDDAVIEAALEASFETFGSLSLVAMRKIIPYLEQGLRYDQAALAAGYHHSNTQSSAVKHRLLPKPSLDDIRNPVVFRAVNQAVKLINAAIKQYGSPDAIHIELARDLSKSYSERKDDEKRMDQNRKANEKDRSQYVEVFQQEPKGQDYRKWRFYREQQGVCPYCLKSIDEGRLPEANYVEIDHILPWSRSYDDSLGNKVLVHAGCNRNKGNRTPFEVCGEDDNNDHWQNLEAWVRGTPSLPKGKRERLLRRGFGKDAAAEFRDRHLNDTRYIARYLKNHIDTHLRSSKGEGRVQTVSVNGRMTAFMRARWGLLKVRSDSDLHHALDAAVVACCGQGMVQRVARWHKSQELKNYQGPIVDDGTGELMNPKEVRLAEQQFPLPWDHFRHELLGRLNSNPKHALENIPGYLEQHGPVMPVHVSRSPRVSGTGQVHQETIRSVAEHLQQPDQPRQASVKVKLQDLNLKKLESMSGYEDPRNATLVAAIRERLEAFKGDGKKAFADTQPPLYMPANPKKPNSKQPIVRSVRLVDSQTSGMHVREGFASNGDMLRIDIFTDGKKYFVVPVYAKDLYQPLPVKAVVPGREESEWEVMRENHKFLFSLYRDSYIRITLKKGEIEGYWAGLDRSTGAISIRAHDKNPEFGKEGIKRSIGVKTAFKLEKYHVNALGIRMPVLEEIRLPLPKPAQRTRP